MDLSETIHVRFPAKVLERLQAEQRETGVPVSLLVRRAVMREYPVPEEFGKTEHSTENKEASCLLQEPEEGAAGS